MIKFDELDDIGVPVRIKKGGSVYMNHTGKLASSPGVLASGPANLLSFLMNCKA